MAYQINPQDGDIIINGFDQGIGASPTSGLTDLKNVNIDSIPGEASVAFSTSSLTQAPVYTNISGTAFGDGFGITFTGLTSGSYIELGQAVTVSASTISGFTAGTVYYVSGANPSGTSETLSFITTYGSASQQAIGTTGTATISVVPMILGTRGALIKNYVQESRAQAGPGTILAHWIADSNGRVWSDVYTTAGTSSTAATSSWTFTGNTIDSTSKGNGLVYFTSQNSNGIDGWLFLFRNSQIDYLKIISNGAAIATTSLAWVYGWKPSTGAIGQTNYLTPSTVYGSTAPLPHEAIVTPGGNGGFVNYCDGYNIGQFSQFARGTAFDPQTLSTYNFAIFPVLPMYDIAQCLSYSGSQMLIGGRNNTVYPWDLVSNFPTPPLIGVPENNIQSLVSVNSNTYIFAGNRGRIYITNGSQANLWKKVPDHISGTVQPIFQWGATGYALNKLYFSLFIGQSSSAPLIASTNNYGGLWAVNLETEAMHLSNVLSDGSYTGFAPAFFAFTNVDTLAGYGFFAGWTSNTQATSGVDVTVSTPYTGTQATIVSDLIPVGTAIQPNTPAQFEYKLSMPMVSGESLELQVGSSLADYVNNTFTTLGTTTGSGTATSGTIYSELFPSTVQNQQWLLVKSIMKSTGSSPSYTRLTELRVKGITKSQPAQSNFVTE